MCDGPLPIHSNAPEEAREAVHGCDCEGECDRVVEGEGVCGCGCEEDKGEGMMNDNHYKPYDGYITVKLGPDVKDWELKKADARVRVFLDWLWTFGVYLEKE